MLGRTSESKVSVNPRRRSPPGIVDVARAAGVSTATVSRCLNEPERVREATRERVAAAIRELDYAPHFGARALVLNRTNTMGAVIPTMANAIFARGLQALQERLAEAGVTLLVATSGYDPAREAEQIRVLVARGVDGLMLVGEDRAPAVYRFLRDRNVPYVLAWAWRAGRRHVYAGFDNAAAAARMAEVVIAEGHRDIGMIAGVTAGNDRARARLAGVRDALASAGLGLPPARVVEAPYDIERGAHALDELVDRTPALTAVICGNDVLAVGALAAARRRGRVVPTALSIVGFDDLDIARIVSPALTTVHVPHRAMAETAADQLLELRAGDRRVTSVRLATTITRRGTLGPPPR
jgi:LacI family transcriptional regulator